jgi:phage baseplate assembly protein W
MVDLYGTDILLDENGDFMISSNGDVEIASGRECLKQDVKNRLLTYPGDLIDDENYGVGLQQFINSEDSQINRLEIKQLIKTKLTDEPRIELDSIEPEVLFWKDGSIEVAVSYTPISEDNPVNLILKIGSDGIEVI